MSRKPTIAVNVDDLNTWAKYQKKMCDHCKGTCCSLPVEVQAKDLVRMGVIDAFELDENMKRIFKRLSKQQLVEHYHTKSEMFTLARMANGDCLYPVSYTHLTLPTMLAQCRSRGWAAL